MNAPQEPQLSTLDADFAAEDLIPAPETFWDPLTRVLLVMELLEGPSWLRELDQKLSGSSPLLSPQVRGATSQG
ncbi:hypothetical protein [Streptomyces sp. NPDC005438]|uniref:hypothetical protein n=1 Tax=Streptomyces sp. NPDC005438 TaxID=3156880 RepID=UPI00339EF8C2